MNKTEILVVGAGPTGLTAAAELTHLGVKVRIVDKAAARSDKSKALGVQAGTLEALAASFGETMSAAMVRAGHPVRAANLHVDDRPPIHIEIGSIPSVYNFVLILPQSQTEKFLEEKLNELGVQVERETELVALTEQNGAVTARLRKNGSEETEITASFVVGADGAHSTVRHQLQLPFTGDAYGNDFILADVELEWPWGYGSVHAFISQKGFAACFPFDDGKNYRIVVAQIAKDKNAEAEVTLPEFSALVKKYIAPEIKILRASWLSRFSVSHRVTTQLQYGRIFLAGDAAHIHSPIGGQGMNTGIQDALNLGHKLFRVLRQNAPLESLKTYEKERLPVAQRLVRSTDFVTRVGLSRNNVVTRLVKTQILPFVATKSWVQRFLFRHISQVNIARAEIKSRMQ